ncbi:hypothetical protein CsatB_002702 [Cannabis sativa]
MNVAFYYLRKKVKQDQSLNQRITTTDCVFDQLIFSEYNKFLENHSNPSTINFDSVISRYILGEYLFSNTAWVFTDHVLIIVHVKDQSHWILIHFSIKDRMLNVYNSLSGLRNQNKALPHVKAYSVMLPYFLEFLNFYASRPDLSMEVGPYSVGIREPINYTFIKGLPTQKKSDCGVFVIKFADLFINGKINEIPQNMADRIATYRDDLAVSLFTHAWRKQIGGYQTEDDVQVRKEKSKKLKEKKNAKGKGKEV